MDTNPQPSRRIVSFGNGRASGPITRLIDPGLLGETLKPFVFLDHLKAVVPANFGFGFHPHSGIATLTYHLLGDVNYQDSSGKKGLLRAKGVEWMVSGSGVWHQGKIASQGAIEGFQLWLALEPSLEASDAHSQYVSPEEVAANDNVRILLGQWGNVVSKISSLSGIDLFHISLRPGETWTYPSLEGRQHAWAYAFAGELIVNGTACEDRLAIFDRSSRKIDISAGGETEFIFGAAQAHPYPLVMGAHSVHTSQEALRKSEQRIRELELELSV